MTYYTFTFASCDADGKITSRIEREAFNYDAEAVLYASFFCESDDSEEVAFDEFSEYLAEYYAQTDEELDIGEVSDKLDEINTLCPGGTVCLSIHRFESKELMYLASDKILGLAL